MTTLKRGMIVDVDLDPTVGSETGKVRPAVIVTNDVYNQRVPIVQVVPLTGWTEKKSRIKTNVTISAGKQNGLDKKSVADCLQTRPIDARYRIRKVRGVLNETEVSRIDKALKIVFALT